MTIAYKINKNRLLNTIHETAKWGAKNSWGKDATETGVCRLALTDLDKQVRDWFVEQTSELGCQIKIDQVGNIFAIYPGQNDGLPIGIGSHLDTQPTGGRYDGIYGVLSGLEVLRTLKDNNIVPKYPIAVINWCNEEGARFPMSIMASSVWSGQMPIEKVYALESIEEKVPVTVEHELAKIGYLGTTKASYKTNPLAAHFEIHIEQGPVLEDENKKIGIVTGVQAYTWYKVKVEGKAQHTGTTPFRARSDALLAASKMIVKGNEIATEAQGLFSVGKINLEGAVSYNVIPHDVFFSIDIRHVEDDKMHAILQEVKKEFQLIAKESGKNIAVTFEEVQVSPGIKFHPDCIASVRKSAYKLFGESQCRDIVSGAGHDSCSTSSVVPTSMIFIPSRDGVSHSPEEYSTPQQIEDGFNVLLEAVLDYDSKRTH